MNPNPPSPGDQLPAPRSSDPALLRHLPSHRGELHEETSEGTLRDQPDGRVDSEGNHPVLRICSGETEGPLPQHALLQAANQPGKETVSKEQGKLGLTKLIEH